MENPESRPEAAKLIDDVIKAHYDISPRGDVIGLSLAMKIYMALKDAGYLTEGS